MKNTAHSFVRRARRGIARTRRYAVCEPLESRIAPAAVFWDGGGDAVNWTSANNWRNNLVPTSVDDVTINPGTTVTVVLSSGVQSVASLSMPGDDALSISGGSLALAGASAIHNLALGGSGSLFANAALSLTGAGSFSGSATLGGTAVVTNNGTLGITSGEPNLQTELVNVGTIQHGNAFLDLDGAAAKLRTISGGLYETVTMGSGYSFRAFNDTPGVFIEAGGILRQATPNGADFSIGAGVPFSVTGGTLQTTGAGSSQLNLNGAGVLTNATLSPNVGTVINFANENTVVGTLSGSGAGSINLASGVLHATAAGAELNFPANFFVMNGSGTLGGPGIFTNTGTIHIGSGDPNLTTELVNAGTIRHGNAFFDLDGAAAKIRTVAGGLYETVTTGSGYSFRVSGGAQGVFVEVGGILRQATPNGADFSIGAGVPFSVTGGTLQTTGAGSSQLNLNGAGVLTNATLSPNVGTVINFANENTVVGTLSGSGAGSINLASGVLHATAAGAELNFPANFFVMNGSGTLGGPGIFTNTGTIHIGSGDPNLTTELVNAGTIRHGNAFFDLDGAAAKIRTVAGGLYETVTTGSGYSFRVSNGSPGVFIEPGATFRHNTSNGANFNTGAATPFSNLGKVEVALGALNFTTPPVEISGLTSAATLTGGAWEVASGATLNLGITGLRTNAADITVRGTGGFTGLGALATNSGALSLLAGADLTTAQVFTNSGALTLSAGSVLTVPSFTQSSTGSAAFEIGGATAAQIGRIATAGAATLAGTASVSVTGSFAPQAGQNFALMNFASRTGAFASVTGLNVGHAPLFEVVNSATTVSLNSLVNASDLAVETVSTPGPVAAGNDVSFSYTVRNTGAFVTPVATWNDTVYLSKDGVLDSSDIVLTRIAHNGAVAAGDTYTANITVPLVGALPADYQIIVVTDALGRVADTDRSDNTLASTGAFTLSIPTLTAGVAFNGTIASGRDQYFQITLPAGQAPTFTFTGAVNGQAEIFESIGTVPTRSTFFASAFAAGSTVQRITGETSAAATYYILVHGRENAGAGQNFSLTADALGFDITDAGLDSGSSAGRVTTTLTGSQFTPNTTFTPPMARSRAPRAQSISSTRAPSTRRSTSRASRPVPTTSPPPTARSTTRSRMHSPSRTPPRAISNSASAARATSARPSARRRSSPSHTKTPATPISTRRSSICSRKTHDSAWRATRVFCPRLSRAKAASRSPCMSCSV